MNPKPSQSSPSTARRMLHALSLFTLVAWALVLALFAEWAPARAFAAQTVMRVARLSQPHAARAGFELPAPVPMPVMAAAFHGTAPMAVSVSEQGFAYSTSDDGDSDGFSWSVSDGRGNHTGENMHNRGSARREPPQFWFRDNGREYVVRDPALVREAQAAVQPLQEIGGEMGKVGGQMGRHGAEMGRIGGRMGTLGGRIGALQAQLATGAASRSERQRIRGELAEVRAQMEALQEQMASVRDHDQDGLSARMAELSAKHRDALRTARVKIRDLAERAKREGKAERPHANA